MADRQEFSRIEGVMAAMAPFLTYLNRSTYMERRTEPGICDFVFGNPHEMPLPGVVNALGRWHVPQNKDWFAYKLSEEEPRQVVARRLSARHGIQFDPDDIHLTNGAFAALSVSICALTNPDDEVIFMTPPWFFYEAIIAAYQARPVKIPVDKNTFDLDLGAIERAITPRTRVILINSPNNPTGKIYPPETLARLASMLERANAANGQTIYLLSDEAYSRILLDGRAFHPPALHYPDTVRLYTYGKTLLAPGQRIGFIALSPSMPGRAALRDALFAAQLVTGYAFPNALLQHALADLEELSIDLAAIQRKRDRLAAELGRMGYQVYLPEATFYLMVKSPIPDDRAFLERLAAHGVFCLPGSVVELPGTFRISLTASEDMIERSLAGFAAALSEVRQNAAD